MLSVLCHGVKGYLGVQGGFLLFLGGYLGGWVNQIGGQDRWVGQVSGYIRWLGSSGGSGK